MQPVLVVDDDQNVLTVVEAILNQAGYTACTATSVKEASELLEKENVCMAILDVFLPDGTGLELAKKIKERDPELPVVIVTGDPNDNNVRIALDMGVNAYLIKPITVSKLLSVIEELT